MNNANVIHALEAHIQNSIAHKLELAAKNATSELDNMEQAEYYGLVEETAPGADLTATGPDMFADNDSENCASMEYMMDDGADTIEYKDCPTCWGYCSKMGDWACDACDSTGEVEAKKYDTTGPEVGLVDYEHVNLNTEATPMTIITDTTDLAEIREAFGDDYVMYCGWCASLSHPTAKVVPISKEAYFNLTEQQGGADLTATGSEDELNLNTEVTPMNTIYTEAGLNELIDATAELYQDGYESHIDMPESYTDEERMRIDQQFKASEAKTAEYGRLLDEQQLNLNTEVTTMNTIDMTNINKSSFISITTATLHNNGRTPVQSVVIATGLMNYLEELGNCSIEDWVAEVSDIMSRANLKAGDKVLEVGDLTGWFDTVVHAGLINENGQVGERLVSIMLETEKAYPQAAFHGVSRRKPVMPHNSTHKAASKVSPLMQKAVDVLQATEYNVDEFMLRVALRTNNKEEGYVLDGCKYLIENGNVPVVAEFFADRRGRLYQGDAHGPNGQSSDMARALMDLHGVHTNYDIPKAIQVVRDEMDDMVCRSLDVAISVFNSEVTGVHSAAEFITTQVELKQQKAQDMLTPAQEAMLIVTKPYSFTKAMRVLNALEKGERPYIGMAFGLDAKCSGPQYGAIMTGDREIARATGFNV